MKGESLVNTNCPQLQRGYSATVTVTGIVTQSLYCKRFHAGKALMTEETIEHITAVIGAKGSDAWYQMPVEELLPDSLKDQADKLDKGQDTMDVWYAP